jgi:hypothetical protein
MQEERLGQLLEKIPPGTILSGREYEQSGLPTGCSLNMILMGVCKSERNICFVIIYA